MKLLILAIVLLATGAPAAHGQERAPSGQIYELLPAVGLEGVRLEIFVDSFVGLYVRAHKR